MVSKVYSLKEAIDFKDSVRASGKKIVSSNGCFDILHIGHIRNLQSAKKLGDVLMVGINSDTSVKKLKGESRPIISENERAEMLAALDCVDCVFIFSEETPISWIKQIKPDVHAKSREYEHHPALGPEREAVELGGGEVVFVPHIEGNSTTNIISKIVNVYK